MIGILVLLHTACSDTCAEQMSNELDSSYWNKEERKYCVILVCFSLVRAETKHVPFLDIPETGTFFGERLSATCSFAILLTDHCILLLPLQTAPCWVWHIVIFFLTCNPTFWIGLLPLNCLKWDNHPIKQNEDLMHTSVQRCSGRGLGTPELLPQLSQMRLNSSCCQELVSGSDGSKWQVTHSYGWKKYSLCTG